MINKEIRYVSSRHGITVSMEVSFTTDDEAIAFITAANSLLVGDESAANEKMIKNVLLQAKNMSIIELIKTYRQIANVGLKEAKDWVEANMEAYIVRPSYNQYW